MNNDDYKEALFYAASIFNERLGAEFSEDNLVLRCFQTENQQEVFEQFCKQYFPDRLEDRYTVLAAILNREALSIEVVDVGNLRTVVEIFRNILLQVVYEICIAL